MADQTPVIIWVTDESGECTYLSRSWYGYTGQPQETGLGTGFIDAIYPEDRGQAGDEFARAVKEKTPYESEFRLLREDGSSAQIRCQGEPRFSSKGEFVGHIGSIVDISDHKVAEEEMRNAVERLSLAQKTGNVGIWDWNAAADTVYWSEQMWVHYGLEPRKEVPKTFWSDHIFEADRERVTRKVAETLAGPETDFRDEYRIVKRNGEVRWIESAATLERDDEGKPVRMYGVNLDVTERRMIEERLRAGESQLRLVTDSLPALVSYIGRDRKYRYVNRLYSEWFGLAPEDVIGRTMVEVLGESAVTQLEPNIRKVLQGEQVSFEIWLEYRVAGRKFVHVAYVPDIRSDGVTEGFYALVSDFSEQRRVQDKLRLSEERMKVLTESFTDYAIISLDPAGVINSWNPGGANIFGYSEGEILGKSVQGLFTPEDRENDIPAKEMKKAQEFGRAWDERWHLRKDGSRFFAGGVMTPLFEDGMLTGFAKIASDLTEKRRQAEELQHAYDEMEMRVLERTKELEAANKILIEQQNERRTSELQRIQLLQRLVTTQEDERRRIARDLHDQLGQRLTALRLKLSSLDDLCVEYPQLHARTTRLKQIAELLDSEVGFLAWELRPAALDELGLVAALRTFIREWSLHYEIPAEFHTSGTQNLRLPTDVETQVYRITQEALNNVIKHAKAGEISVIFERVEDTVILIVEDDGQGFVPEMVQAGPDDGRGLGLQGMKERAELMNGEVEIESAPAAGTTIYLRIPINGDKLESKTE